MAERYRDLVRPTLVDVAARSTPTGAPEAAQALSQKFSSFSRLASDIGGKLNAQLGAQAGAEEGAAGNPEFRSGLRSMTAYGQAYNDAALRSYAIRSEADMEQTAARLEIEAANDPAQFAQAMEQVRDSILEEAPTEAHGVITDAYNRRIAAGAARLQAALSTEIREEDRGLVNEQIDRSIERITFLRAQDTPESYAESVEEETRMGLLIDAAVADGTLTDVEGVATQRRLKRRVIYETVAARFDQELDSPYGDPIGFIEDLKEENRTSNVLTTEEEQQLENELLAELRERNSLAAMRASEAAATNEARLDAGDRYYTGEMLAGNLTRRRLLEAVRNEELAPAIARTLLNELQSSAASPPRSDPETLFRYETNLLSFTEEDIMTEPGLTWEDRSQLIQDRREEETTWKGTQVAREAFERIDRALGIVPGISTKLLTEEEARARDVALSELYDRVDALPPEERQGAILNAAQEVIRDRIRQEAANNLERYRRQREQYIQQMRERIGPVEDMNDRQREAYDAELQRLDNLIREAENRRQ